MKEILLVDDDQDMCELLSELLTALGAGSCVAAHSLEDVRRLERLPRDVAVIDVNLGKNVPNGVDVHRWLKEHDFQGRVVFLTGHAQSNPIVRAALGVPNVTLLTKPVSVEQLLSAIEGAPWRPRCDPRGPRSSGWGRSSRSARPSRCSASSDASRSPARGSFTSGSPSP